MGTKRVCHAEVVDVYVSADQEVLETRCNVAVSPFISYHELIAVLTCIGTDLQYSLNHGRGVSQVGVCLTNPQSLRVYLSPEDVCLHHNLSNPACRLLLRTHSKINSVMNFSVSRMPILARSSLVQETGPGSVATSP